MNGGSHSISCPLSMCPLFYAPCLCPCLARPATPPLGQDRPTGLFNPAQYSPSWIRECPCVIHSGPAHPSVVIEQSAGVARVL